MLRPVIVCSISIHAPREGCDCLTTTVSPSGALFQSTHPVRGATSTPTDILQIACISIHAPREGCDKTARKTTTKKRISIHAPREGCDSIQPYNAIQRTPISIHAPREGCDFCMALYKYQLRFQSTHPVRGATITDTWGKSTAVFQSTHPVRGATNRSTSSRTATPISIHAPREGCDHYIYTCGLSGNHFNPRTP